MTGFGRCSGYHAPASRPPRTVGVWVHVAAQIGGMTVGGALIDPLIVGVLVGTVGCTIIGGLVKEPIDKRFSSVDQTPRHAMEDEANKDEPSTDD